MSEKVVPKAKVVVLNDVTLDSKTSVEYFLANFVDPLEADSVKVTSHRHIHILQYNRVGVEGPNECRVIVERTDANKKLFLVFFKKNFDPQFQFRDSLLFTFVRELTITKNKRDLDSNKSKSKGFLAKCLETKHKLSFGEFLFQNEKVCEINPESVTDSIKERRYRISFDHLNRNLVINNDGKIESKRPVAEITIMVETKDHLSISSFLYKHFSGKGAESRKGQELFNDYDCTTFLIKKDGNIGVVIEAFLRGVRRGGGPEELPEWSIFGDKLDYAQYNNLHRPSRNTPVIFHGKARNYKLSKRSDEGKRKTTGKKKKPERDEEDEDEEGPPKKKRKL